MSILDKKGISVTSGFKLVSGQPLDARNVVDDLDGLQDLVNNGAAYEGIVVYVKSEQQLKQYNGSEWNNVYPESDIITVNSLPNIENAKLDKIYRVPKLLISFGTALPNTGTVGNIHFNTTLSIKQVEDILNELTFTGEAYLVLAASDETPVIVVYKHTDPEGMLIRSEGSGILWANEGAVQNYASTYGITHAGWQEFDNPIVLNEEVKATAGGASVGTQNPLLTGLIFTDPYSEKIVGFTYHRRDGNNWIEVLNGGSGGGSSGGSSDFIDVDVLPEISSADLTKVYRIPTVKFTGGTSVPSSGTIEKVYINTSLSNDEIIDIMSSVDLVQVPGFSGDLYAVVTTADFSNALSITKDTDDNDRYIVQVVNGEQNLLWSSRNGWVVNNWEINCGYNNMLSVVALQLGGTVQNDKLKNLISATPFEKELIGYKYYRVVNGEWAEVLTESTYIIEKSYQDIVDSKVTFTNEEWDIIINKTNVVLKGLKTNEYYLFDKCLIFADSSNQIVLFSTTINNLVTDSPTVISLYVNRNNNSYYTRYIQKSFDDFPTRTEVNELIDEKLATGGTGGGSSDFVDVEELPEADSTDLSKIYRVTKVVGTPVPNTGTVGDVIFNTFLIVYSYFFYNKSKK